MESARAWFSYDVPMAPATTPEPLIRSFLPDKEAPTEEAQKKRVVPRLRLSNSNRSAHPMPCDWDFDFVEKAPTPPMSDAYERLLRSCSEMEGPLTPQEGATEEVRPNSDPWRMARWKAARRVRKKNQADRLERERQKAEELQRKITERLERKKAEEERLERKKAEAERLEKEKAMKSAMPSE